VGIPRTELQRRRSGGLWKRRSAEFKSALPGQPAPLTASRSQRLLPWVFRILAVVALVLSIYLILEGELWIGILGGVSSISIAIVSGLYVVTEYCLSRSGRAPVESIVLAVLFVNVFLQTYELVYHFTFPVYLNYFRPPFLNGDAIRYIVLEVIMLLPLLLVRKNIKLRRLSVMFVFIFILVWAEWILCGFPQYFSGGYFYPIFIPTNDPYHLSLYLNFGSKVVLAGFFASLLRSQKTTTPLVKNGRIVPSGGR
jgi:hypothetical protein